MQDSKIPHNGRSWEEIRREMLEAREADLPWVADHSFKPAYFAGDDIVNIANQAYQMYITDNALYAHSAFPSLHRYETEVTAMVLEILNAPGGAGGSLSTGGTESNFMAVKTARDWARTHLPHIRKPNLVVPRTAHPSFDKAAHMLGLDVIRASGSPHYKADVEAMGQAINSDTIMIIASAPPYPYGETDPVEEIAELANSHGLWMHVDGCLGGFILPFARHIDHTIPMFDFAVPGVTSMSADIHKYGYAAKGISALLLRDANLERYQRSTFDNWPSGLYATDNISGSRSGGALASAWAVMNHLGWQGYMDIVQKHVSIRDRFIEVINDIKSLYVLAKPHAYNFAFASNELDIYAVSDGMIDRGWTLGRSNEPASIQLMINLVHESAVHAFAEDLQEVTMAVQQGKIVASDAESIYAN
ncbi:MAG: sphinganine-1-phosphate aldolase [Parasphingorhabdus sp.]|jgi:sphinganine-1-phosphate aldolase